MRLRERWAQLLTNKLRIMTYKKLRAQEKKAEKLLSELQKMAQLFDAETGVRFVDVWDRLSDACNSLDWAIEYMYAQEDKM